MEILRTPDERFVNLPGYPFEPRYVEVDGVRIHYVHEGPRQAPPVLLLHGEPSWSYLYRKMIPRLVEAGLRVIAPDLVGFGRSDKPARREDYTYQRHVDWMLGFICALDLEHITLVCQDWGGLIGLRLVAEHGQRFDRVVAANTFLPTGDQPMPEAFLTWQKFSQQTPELPIGQIIQMGCVSKLPPEVIAAYEAPFPDERYKAGARQFPLLVPTRPDDPASEPNRKAWEALRRWRKPFLTAFSDQDPITRGADSLLQALIPGAAGQPHTTIHGAGHFLQEDRGEELAQVVVSFIRATPLR
ncbi:Haloalkane dehalogenase 1 [bacterium HR30]|nr:Haloalkane dehalogenase 1 [bacterium HR30]